MDDAEERALLILSAQKTLFDKFEDYATALDKLLGQCDDFLGEDVPHVTPIAVIAHRYIHELRDQLQARADQLDFESWSNAKCDDTPCLFCGRAKPQS